MGDESATTNASRPTSTGSSRKARQTKIDRFWQGMTQMFGVRWTSQYGETPSEIWTLAIDSLTATELKTAYRTLLGDGNDHPPTLPRFIALARQDGGKRSSRFPEPFTAEWNEGRKTTLAKIAKLTADRGIAFTPEERAVSHHALALAELSPGMIGYETATEAYARDGALRLERLTGRPWGARA